MIDIFFCFFCFNWSCWGLDITPGSEKPFSPLGWVYGLDDDDGDSDDDSDDVN